MNSLRSFHSISIMMFIFSSFLLLFFMPAFSAFLSSNLQDFSVNPNRTYPTSCCASDITDQISTSHKPLAAAVVFRTDDGLREHQRNISDIAEAAWSHVITKDSSRSSSGGAILNSESKIIATCRAVYPQVKFISIITQVSRLMEKPTGKEDLVSNNLTN